MSKAELPKFPLFPKNPPLLYNVVHSASSSSCTVFPTLNWREKNWEQGTGNYIVYFHKNRGYLIYGYARDLRYTKSFYLLLILSGKNFVSF